MGKICWYNNKKYKEKILKVFKTFNKNLVLKNNLQIAFYKTNDFYTWHRDDMYPENHQKDKYWFVFVREWQRMFSITVELQPAPKAGLYLDSNLYPFIPRNKDLTIKLKQGQGFVFPSKDMHMTRNLGPGERISLVAWGSELVK
jgi:predicted 2-oxoglutarate/Fe(II)-dependent dioxygenase YbiX